MKYDIPILSAEHSEFCRKEAERRYCGTMVRDDSGMLLVRDAEGICHTDAVLRSLSMWEPRSDLGPVMDE
jgi:hypothetical protein